jgi:hypothetical protein
MAIKIDIYQYKLFDALCIRLEKNQIQYWKKKFKLSLLFITGIKRSKNMKLKDYNLHNFIAFRRVYDPLFDFIPNYGICDNCNNEHILWIFYQENPLCYTCIKKQYLENL